MYYYRFITASPIHFMYCLSIIGHAPFSMAYDTL